MFSLRYCKHIVNLFFLVLWACLATYIQSDTIVLWETFVFISRQKINFIPCFCVDIPMICKLIFVILDMPVSTHPKWQYHLAEDFDFYLHAKNKLHHSLLMILHFKESCNLIGWQHFGHNSRPKILPDCWSNINNNISSQFRLFSRKINVTKFFKTLKKPYFWTILGPFCPNLGKYEFSWKEKA